MRYRDADLDRPLGRAAVGTAGLAILSLGSRSEGNGSQVDGSRAMSEDTGVWAYAITEDEHLAGPDGELVDLSWLTGVGEAKVRATASCGLTVLVSDVSLAEYGAAALRANLEDVDWLNQNPFRQVETGGEEKPSSEKIMSVVAARLSAVNSAMPICPLLVHNTGRPTSSCTRRRRSV